MIKQLKIIFKGKQKDTDSIIISLTVTILFLRISAAVSVVLEAKDRIIAKNLFAKGG